MFNGLLYNFLKWKIYAKIRPAQYNKIQKHKTTFAKKLTNTLPKLGPAFTKLGQFLSVRDDLIDETLRNELLHLQDAVEPLDWSKMSKVMNDAFRVPAESIFYHIDTKPVASASIAQVYKVNLIDHNLIALKVLKPNITKKFAHNIELLIFFAKITNFLTAKSKRLRLLDIIETIRVISNIELNLQYEASASQQIKENLNDNHHVYIPQVYWDYCTEKTLGMEWVDGIKLSEIKKHNIPQERINKIAYNIAIIFFNQVYKDGFFHADLHQGNIMINKKDQIILVDFGIVSFLPRKDRIFLAEILYAFMNRDYYRVALLHFKAGYVPKSQSVKIFALACRSIAEPIFNKKTNEIDISSLLTKLFSITSMFQMETQPQLIMLQKNLVIVEGIIKNLNPNANLWEIARPWFKEFNESQQKYCNKFKLVEKKVKQMIHDGITEIETMILDEENY